MDSSYRHLAFLLSIGGLPLACVGGDGETSTDSATTTTTTGTTTGTTGTTGTTDDTSTSSGTSSTSDTTGTTTTTTGDETTGETTGPASAACEAYAASYSECFPRYTERELIADCEDSRAAFIESGADGCGDAFDDLYTCLAGATCDQIGEEAHSDICPAQSEAMIKICFGVGATCEAYADQYAECFGEVDPFIGAACQMELDYAAGISTECGDAQEELFACLNALDCADFTEGNGCDAEGEALDKACG